MKERHTTVLGIPTAIALKWAVSIGFAGAFSAGVYMANLRWQLVDLGRRMTDQETWKHEQEQRQQNWQRQGVKQ